MNAVTQRPRTRRLRKPSSVVRRVHSDKQRMHGRLEDTRLGRLLINFVVFVTLAAILVTNLPYSQIKAHLLPWAQPYLNATGLEQDWGIFAPDPRGVVVFVEGHIDYTDGATSVWQIPARPGLWEYSDYRWQKFGDNLRLDNNAWAWPQFAEYLANRARADGHQPVRVTLIRRYWDLLPPGPGPEKGPVSEYAFFTKSVGGGT
jgi:hypothetical protein